MRIAVVDDDEEFLSLVRELFDLEGWETLWPSPSDSTMGWVRREYPDVIMVDLRTGLPDGGLRLLEDRESDPVVRGIPALVCSGDTVTLDALGPWLRERGIGALAKPFDIDDLYRRVRKALETRQPALSA